MNDTMDLTPAQERALRIVDAQGTVTCRQLARCMWPDSPGWDTTPRRRDGRPGGRGATMPMLAGRLLNRMRGLGVVRRLRPGSGRWCVAAGGRQWLDVNADPKQEGT